MKTARAETKGDGSPAAGDAGFLKRDTSLTAGDGAVLKRDMSPETTAQAVPVGDTSPMKRDPSLLKTPRTEMKTARAEMKRDTSLFETSRAEIETARGEMESAGGSGAAACAFLAAAACFFQNLPAALLAAKAASRDRRAEAGSQKVFHRVHKFAGRRDDKTTIRKTCQAGNYIGSTLIWPTSDFECSPWGRKPARRAKVVFAGSIFLPHQSSK